MNVALYISGHGYGHATRVMEVARALLRLKPEVRFTVHSIIPEWLVRLNLNGYAEYRSVEIDVGVKQKDSYYPDKLVTLQAAAELWQRCEDLVEREIDFLRSHNTRLIFADLPPLAFEIGTRAGIPTVGMGNFSWDWIYEPYTQEHPEFKWVLRRIEEAYRRCPVLLRLPFHGGLRAFPKVIDIPLVARRAEQDPREIRNKIGLRDETRPIVLVALRLEDMVSVNWERIAAECTGYRFVAFQQIPLRNAVILPPDFVRFQELVNASDIVVSKPGYGIVSECIANRKPLAYTERFDFREYHVLVRALEDYGSSECIPHRDFIEGKWLRHLRAIEAKALSEPRSYDTNGAAVAASFLVEQLEKAS